MDLVKSKGKTKGVEYYVNPDLLRRVNFKGKTNLKKIEDHRLRELIIQDLQVYPNSLLSDIHERIGKEISVRQIRKQLTNLINEGSVRPSGGRKFRYYSFIS